MKSLVRGCTAILLCSATVLTMAARADDDKSFKFGTVRVSSGALSLVGTISTLSLADEHPAFSFVGWSLIVVGSLMDNKDLSTDARSQELNPALVWDAMVREAKVVADNPSMGQPDTGIANAATKLNLQSADLAKLVLELDREKGSLKDSREIESEYFPAGLKSPIQRQALNNLVALAQGLN